MIDLVKTAAKTTLCTLYKATGLPRLQERSARARGLPGMAILLFHRVTDAIPEDGITVSTARFHKICRMLRANFRVVSLDEIVRRSRADEPIPPRTVAITFDDAYANNLEAARILAAERLPASFFLPTGVVGTERRFSWDHTLPVELRNLTWDEVVELSQMGFTIGSHTVNHLNLAALPYDQVRRELIDSRKMLEDRIGCAVRWFAYPCGEREHCLPEGMGLVEEAGYEACFGAYDGFIRRGFREAVFPRKPAPYFHSIPELELHLKGCLQWMYALKRKVGLQR